MIKIVSNRNKKVICMNMNFATNSSRILGTRGTGVSTSEHLVDSEAVS